MIWLQELVFEFFFFFFQAEDGIRDGTVTGVQTCALPISGRQGRGIPEQRHQQPRLPGHGWRSEERRVGKSVDLGGRRIIKKKKGRYVRCDVNWCYKNIVRW